MAPAERVFGELFLFLNIKMFNSQTASLGQASGIKISDCIYIWEKYNRIESVKIINLNWPSLYFQTCSIQMQCYNFIFKNNALIFHTSHRPNAWNYYYYLVESWLIYYILYMIYYIIKYYIAYLASIYLTYLAYTSSINF